MRHTARIALANLADLNVADAGFTKPEEIRQVIVTRALKPLTTSTERFATIFNSGELLSEASCILITPQGITKNRNSV